MTFSQMLDAVVIGCGASGVAALCRLHDAGLKVLGLEADGRIGGRIYTVPFGEHVVDIGAQWCHGEKDNAVYELVKDMNVLGRPGPDTKQYFFSNGEVLPSEKVEEILKYFDGVLDKADKDNEEGIPAYLLQSLEKALAKKELTDEHLYRSVLEFYKRNNHMISSSESTENKSLKGLVEAWPCDGEFLLNWKDKGFQTLFDILLKDRKIDILTNKVVNSIRWSSESVPGSSQPMVHIGCSDKSLYAARHAIVTIPVGVLQENYKMFTPPLPEAKLNAINSLTMSILDKIYLEFTEPWWPKHPYSITVLWTHVEKKKWLPNEEWITGIYSLTTVEHQPNLMCAWIQGELAVAMEQLDEQDVFDGMQRFIKSFIRNEKAHLATIKRSKWATNPLARGTYSYRSVKTEMNKTGAVNLSEPLCVEGYPLICFAGEATSAHHHGAVHGAVEAGFREAQRIIEYRESKK